jgi:predicted class III extradiol MEMO1 family dioxygenase
MSPEELKRSRPSSSRKMSTVLSDFNQIFIISTDFHTNPQDQISRKFVQWSAILINVDRQTDRQLDMTKLTGYSRDYSNASKTLKWNLKARICGTELGSFGSWQGSVAFVV